MTAPAPTWLADLLSEHGQGGRVNSREGTVMCLCGDWLEVGEFEDPAMGFPDPEIEDRVRSAHVADQVWQAIQERINKADDLRNFLRAAGGLEPLSSDWLVDALTMEDL